MTDTKIKINSWNDLKDEVKNIPIEEIAMMREGELNVEKRGYRLFGLCPFHNDQEIGNFVIGGSLNTFKCFACGESGDSIDLIQKVDGKGFTDALTTIAVEMGVMSYEEVDEFINKGEAAEVKKIDWGLDVNEDYSYELTEEQVKNRNIVYGLLSEGNAIANNYLDILGLEKQEKLNSKHYYQLKEIRNLTDEQIEDAGFFSMDAEFEYIVPLTYRIVNELDLLPNTMNVPGFWRDSKGISIQNINKKDGSIIELEEENKQYYWQMNAINALGIPIKDEDGHIVGLQLRPDKPNNSGKYRWFSSSYAHFQDDKVDGMSPGAQKDIVYPKKWMNPHLFITEGKFKSMAISRYLKSPSISLQGINTYRGIRETIENINDKYPHDVQNVFIAFDGDLSFNDSVMKAILEMVDSELEGYDVHIAVWDYLFGKGIDDLLNNKNGKALTRITVDNLREIFSIIEDLDLENSGLTGVEIKKEKEDIFYRWLKEIKPEVRLHQSRN